MNYLKYLLCLSFALTSTMHMQAMEQDAAEITFLNRECTKELQEPYVALITAKEVEQLCADIQNNEEDVTTIINTFGLKELGLSVSEQNILQQVKEKLFYNAIANTQEDLRITKNQALVWKKLTDNTYNESDKFWLKNQIDICRYDISAFLG